MSPLSLQCGDASSENSMDSLKKSKWRDHFYFALVAVCILVSLCTIILCTLLWSKLSRLEERISAKNNNMNGVTNASEKDKSGEQFLLCQPCTSLVTGPFLEDETDLRIFTRKLVHGEDQCCSVTPEQTGYMVQLMVKRKLAEEMSKVLANCSRTHETSPSTASMPETAPVFAHLLAGRQNTTARSSLSQGHSPPVRNWLSSNRLSLLQGVRVENDHIVVSKKGAYFIYSHVQFTQLFGTTETVDQTSQKLTHQVCRYNILYPNGGEQCLMEATVTKCWTASRRLEDHPSYLAGVFSLEVNDNIYVRVSNTSLLPLDPISTFIGIVKFS